MRKINNQINLFEKLHRNSLQDILKDKTEY